MIAKTDKPTYNKLPRKFLASAHCWFSLALRVFVLWLFIVSVSSASDGAIRLAATTTTENSGLLDVLLDHFQTTTGLEIQSTVAASGSALKQAERGDVDVVLVHSPAAEQAFMAAGYGQRREEIMYNDYIIVGPRDDPGGVQHQSSLHAVLQAIAVNQALFVSRADESGTHQRELQLWRAAAVVPAEDWYREAGQSMAATLRIASELQAYTMTDRGTWLKLSGGLDLAVLHEPAPAELNRYAVISVNPVRHPHVNADGAESLINWLLSHAGQQAILNYRLTGVPAYLPLHIQPAVVNESALSQD